MLSPPGRGSGLDGLLEEEAVELRPEGGGGCRLRTGARGCSGRADRGRGRKELPGRPPWRVATSFHLPQEEGAAPSHWLPSSHSRRGYRGFSPQCPLFL